MSLLTHPSRALLFATTIVLACMLAVGASAISVWRAAHTDDASVVTDVDAILVLGAAQYGGEPSPVFEGRLEHALLLYDDGRSPLVVVLGGGQVGDSTTEADAGVAYLHDRGIPASALLSSPVGSTTWESLLAVQPLLEDRGVTRVFLVSDPWHNLRIKRMASDLGIRGYASATWHSAARSGSTRLDGYVRETLAYLAYRVVGG